ncbi:hypothetical protein L6452_01447 [Arctium lappa]|uniref:Uncharacterized protein n=1 Tax=Arctium lappa TaxID=4217 RepID=A0ACB9FG55_ARCLA|nr:hypothetical protein L6452_01447 [Arctium lappa]
MNLIPYFQIDLHAFITKTSLTKIHAIVLTPFALRSPDFSTNPGRRFYEQVGVKAPGMANRIAFLDLVRSKMVAVWSSPSESNGVFDAVVVGKAGAEAFNAEGGERGGERAVVGREDGGGGKVGFGGGGDVGFAGDGCWSVSL